VGIYSDEYVLVTPDRIPYDAEVVEIDYRLNLQLFIDDWTNNGESYYEKVYDGHMIIKNTEKDYIVSIYRMIHSFYNISGVNNIINAEMTDEYTSFVFDYVKVGVKRGRHTTVIDSRDVSIKDACEYTTPHIAEASRVPYVLYCIDRAFGRDTNKSIINAIDASRIICIDTGRAEWGIQESFKALLKNSANVGDTGSNLLIAMPGMSFNSVNLITPRDLAVLNRLDSYSIGWLMVECEPMDFINSSIMDAESLADLYDDVLLDTADGYIDSNIGLYELSNVVEVLFHFSYILKILEIVRGTMYAIFNRIILNLSCCIADSNHKKMDFVYVITNEDVDDNRAKDNFDDFIQLAEAYLDISSLKGD
jgi:hypothetical protein